jgi:hypothetical protein
LPWQYVDEQWQLASQYTLEYADEQSPPASL